MTGYLLGAGHLAPPDAQKMAGYRLGAGHLPHKGSQDVRISAESRPPAQTCSSHGGQATSLKPHQNKTCTTHLSAATFSKMLRASSPQILQDLFRYKIHECSPLAWGERLDATLAMFLRRSQRSRAATRPLSQLGNSATQPLSHSADQPFSRSATQPLSHSATQPFSRSATQPLSRSATQPVSHSATQPFSH